LNHRFASFLPFGFYLLSFSLIYSRAGPASFGRFSSLPFFHSHPPHIRIRPRYVFIFTSLPHKHRAALDSFFLPPPFDSWSTSHSSVLSPPPIPPTEHPVWLVACTFGGLPTSFDFSSPSSQLLDLVGVCFFPFSTPICSALLVPLVRSFPFFSLEIYVLVEEWPGTAFPAHNPFLFPNLRLSGHFRALSCYFFWCLLANPAMTV